MVLSAGEVAVMKVPVAVHDLNPFQVGFEQIEIATEEWLKIFVLAKAEIGMVWG